MRKLKREHTDAERSRASWRFRVLHHGGSWLLTWHAPWCQSCEHPGSGWRFERHPGYVAGFHRLEAHKRAGRDRIIAEARQGTRRDAVLFSVGANAAHGLRRTNADKRRAVEMLLGDEEWAKKSDRWIATKCGVGHHLVASARAALGESPNASGGNAPSTRLTQDGRAYPIERRAPAPKPSSPEPAEPPPEPRSEADIPLAAEPPQPPEESLPRMRQMTIEDRIGASSVVPEAQPEPPPEPALAQVHHLEGLLFNAAWRAVQRLSNAEWAALIRRESERRMRGEQCERGDSRLFVASALRTLGSAHGIDEHLNVPAITIRGREVGSQGCPS